MSSVCILGVGSPSGDDQAGWLVVDALRAKGLQTDTRIAIEKLDRPGANLVSLLDNAAGVILVDAMQSGGLVGMIRHFDQGDWSDYRHGLSSHGFGVLEALALAQAMGSLPRRLDLYGIEIASADPVGAPGNAVQEAARELAEQIAASLRD